MLTLRKILSALALIALLLPLAACCTISPLASEADVQEVREEIAESAEAEYDAYNQTLAEGRSHEDAVNAALSTNVERSRAAADAGAAAIASGPFAGMDLLTLLGLLLGGGVVGTGMTRVVRGSPLRSSSSKTKPAAPTPATT